MIESAKRVLVLLVTCVALIVAGHSAHAADPEEFKLPPRMDNAAIHYLEGAAVLAVPRSAGEVEALKFIDEKFGKLPPATLSDKPDAVSLLSCDLGTRGAMSSLHEGAQRGSCAFDVNWDDFDPETELPHLRLMLSFARRCIAAAKCAEFQGNPVRAAEICGDVIRMAAHIEQEPILMSGLVGAALRNMAASEAEGLLSRNPGREAIAKLLRALQSVPEPPRVDLYCRSESERYERWIIRKARAPQKEFLDFMHDYIGGEGPSGEMATQELAGLNEAEVRNRIIEWARDYEKHMQKLSVAVSGPYYRAAPALRAEEQRLDDILLDMWRHELSGDRIMGNPLPYLLPPMLVRQAQSFAKVEARLGMMRLLCAAMLLKEETGKYPVSLEELRRYFTEGIPKDPFTGRNYVLSMSNGLPAVGCGAPEEMTKASPNDFSFDLGRRRKVDAEELEKFENARGEPR